MGCSGLEQGGAPLGLVLGVGKTQGFALGYLSRPVGVFGCEGGPTQSVPWAAALRSVGAFG